MFFVICFFATKLNAQLSSEKPALTAEQVANIMKAQAAKTTPASGNVTVAKTTEAGKSTQKAIVSPVVSNQGGINPDKQVPVSEIRIPKVPVQSETPVEKPIEKPVEKTVKSKD